MLWATNNILSEWLFLDSLGVCFVAKRCTRDALSLLIWSAPLKKGSMRSSKATGEKDRTVFVWLENLCGRQSDLLYCQRFL
jgi:hypothetical protein